MLSPAAGALGRHGHGQPLPGPGQGLDYAGGCARGGPVLPLTAAL